MIILIIILVLIALIAAFPVVRDYLKRKRTVTISYTEGLAAILDTKYDEAIELLKQSVAADSNNVDAYLRLADLYNKKGNTELTAQIYERLAVRHNMTKEEERNVFESLGNYYTETGRHQKAIAMFEELINIDKHNIRNYEQLLSLYLKTERWPDCDEMLKKIEKVESNKERLAEILADFGKQISAKRPEDSIKYFKQALSHNRKSIPALVALGDYYYKKHETSVAIEIWKEFLDNFPQLNYMVRTQLEQAYYDLNQYEEVVNFYEKLLKKAPDDVGLYIVLAQIYEKKEDLSAAIKILNKIPAAKKKETLAQVELAKLYLKNSEEAKAKQILETAVEVLKIKQRENL